MSSNNLGIKSKLWLSIGLGQSLSFLICGTAITSGVLGERGVYIPTAQSFLNYILLCSVYTTLLACRKDNSIKEVFKLRGWKYFLLAAVDVEANYLVVKAYHYTTVTSVQLLDSFIIPTVLILSWIFLRVRYKMLHFVGVGVCLLGVVALVLADYFTSQHTSEATNKLLGDFMVLGGSVLYGMSNVGQEYVVKNYNRVEYLGMVGFFGSFINGLQFVLLERKEVAGLDFRSYQIVLALLGFALCLFVLYSLMPIVIEKTSATSVNLNLLSADFYALIVGIFLFHYKFHVLYFISFTCIIIGLVLYSIRPPPVINSQQDDYKNISSRNSSHDPENIPENSTNENYTNPHADNDLADLGEACVVSSNSRHSNSRRNSVVDDTLLVRDLTEDDTSALETSITDAIETIVSDDGNNLAVAQETVTHPEQIEESTNLLTRSTSLRSLKSNSSIEVSEKPS